MNVGTGMLWCKYPAKNKIRLNVYVILNLGKSYWGEVINKANIR